MLMIRLARFGAKKKPFYRIVVIEKVRARNGRNLEVVGHYNPLTDPSTIVPGGVLRDARKRGTPSARATGTPARSSGRGRWRKIQMARSPEAPKWNGSRDGQASSPIFFRLIRSKSILRTRP